MSFLSKVDYFGIEAATSSKMKVVSNNKNPTAQTATAQNEKGDVVAETMYGENTELTCDYVVLDTCALSGIHLGKGSTVNGETGYIVGANITTAAGTPPAINVTGRLVPSEVAARNSDCYYDAPDSGDIVACHHAQWLFGLSAGTQIGSHYFLTGADYGYECDLTETTISGSAVVLDVANGRVTANLTIQGTGYSTSALSQGGVVDSSCLGSSATDWVITSPLTETNPDGGYDTYTIGLTKNLQHASSTTTTTNT